MYYGPTPPFPSGPLPSALGCIVFLVVLETHEMWFCLWFLHCQLHLSENSFPTYLPVLLVSCFRSLSPVHQDLALTPYSKMRPSIANSLTSPFLTVYSICNTEWKWISSCASNVFPSRTQDHGQYLKFRKYSVKGFT